MTFVASTSSFTGDGCSAGNMHKAAVTLEKFFFRGSLQPGKHQGMPLSYRSKRQRTACAGAAAAAAAKRIRPRLTQLRIRECSSFSPATGCSVTPEQSQQAGVAEAAHSCGSAPGGPLQQQDGFISTMKETAEEETCRSSGCLEEVQDPKADRGEMNEKDEINEDDAHGSAEEAASASVVPNGVGNGGFRRAANTSSSATTAADCLLDTNEEGSCSARTAEKASTIEPSAAGSADMNALSNRETPREAAVSLHHVSGGETTMHSVLRRAQRDTGKSYSDATEAHHATIATAAVVERASTATVARVPKSASVAATAQVARTPSVRAKATAAVATSLPTVKNAPPAAVQCAKGLLSRPAAVPVSTPPVPPVDPEGEPLSDVSQLERRWRDALGDCWFEELRRELTLPYFVECLSFVRKERQKHRVFPPAHLLFNAFRTTPLDKIKVIIVGQDPYHQVGQAMGLAFSVPKGIPVPPSLQNIFKEIGRNYPTYDRNDMPGKPVKAQHGDLTDWAKQGVFLMNTVLTVRENSPLSHKNAGWERFTDKVVNIINTRCDGAVFLLWGKPAQKKSSTLDRQRHLILEAGHPSPLSVRFFEGCQHFRKCNEYLLSKGKTQVVFRPRV